MLGDTRARAVLGDTEERKVCEVMTKSFSLAFGVSSCSSLYLFIPVGTGGRSNCPMAGTENVDMTCQAPCRGCVKSLTRDMTPKPKSCSKCRVVYYCSKECQTLDWKRPDKQGHKDRCASLAAAAQTGKRNPRSGADLQKPENDTTRLLMKRIQEVFATGAPEAEIYLILEDMLRDGIASGKRAMLLASEETLGSGLIVLKAVPQQELENIEATGDSSFARQAQMVRNYDPATQFVIYFTSKSPYDEFLSFRMLAKDVVGLQARAASGLSGLSGQAGLSQVTGTVPW